MPAIPKFSANAAKAMGGVGYGIADAGKSLGQYGQSMIDNERDANVLAERQKTNAFNQDIANKRFGLSQSNAARQQSNADRNYNFKVSKRDSENKALEVMGMDYANKNPNNPILGGGHTLAEIGSYARGNRDTKTGSPYATVKTDSGIKIIDKRTGEMSDTPYKQPPKEANYYRSENLQMKKDAARGKSVVAAQDNYAEWDEFTTPQKKYILGEYTKGGMFPKYEENTFSPDTIEGFANRPEVQQQDNERLMIVQKLLEKQNKQLGQ